MNDVGEPFRSSSPARAYVADLRWTCAPDDLLQRGLLGWVDCTLSGILRIRVAVRRTSTGRIALSFPERVDRRGRRHPIVRPATREARFAIERAVLDALAHQLATNTGGMLPPAVSPDEPSGTTPNRGARS